MRLGDSDYSKLVERKQAEIRGNVSSVKLSEASCAAEIKEIMPPEFSGHTFMGTGDGQPFPQQGIPGSPQIQRKRRGRPPGSRNRPKSTAGEK